MKSILLGILFTSIFPLINAMECKHLLVTKAGTKEELAGFIATPEQWRVVNQMDVDEASTDCGYHALFNGLTIAEYIRNASPERRAQLLSWLTRFDAKKKEFFDPASVNHGDSSASGIPKSSWKRLIIAQRAKSRAKEDIFNLLLRSLKGAVERKISDDNPGARELYPHIYHCMNQKDTWVSVDCTDQIEGYLLDKLPAIIQEAANVLTEAADEGDTSSVSFTLSVAAVREALSKALAEKASKALMGQEEEPIRMYEGLQSKGIDHFFDLEANGVKVPYGQGSWLNESEISSLLRENNVHTKATFITEPPISPANLNFFVIGDSGEPIKEVFGREKFKQLKVIMRDEEKNHVAIILIYEPGSSTAQETSGSSRLERLPWPLRSVTSLFISSNPSVSHNKLVAKFDKGHWYTLVLNKVGKTCEFIVADSLSRDNKNRVNDPRVKEIIQELGEESGLDPIVNLQDGGIGLLKVSQAGGEKAVEEKKVTPGSVLSQPVEEESSHESNPVSFKVVDISAKQLPEGASASEIEAKTRDDTYFYNTIVFKIIIVAAFIVVFAFIVKKKWYDTRPDKKAAHDGKNAPAIASTAADPKNSK